MVNEALCAILDFVVSVEQMNMTLNDLLWILSTGLYLSDQSASLGWVGADLPELGAERGDLVFQLYDARISGRLVR